MTGTASERLLEKQWHHVPADKVVELLSCQPEAGLSVEEVTERQAHFGPNQITTHQQQSALVRFPLRFHQP